MNVDESVVSHVPKRGDMGHPGLGVSDSPGGASKIPHLKSEILRLRSGQVVGHLVVDLGKGEMWATRGGLKPTF